MAEGGEGGIQELIEEIVRFRDARDWEQFHTPRNLAMALSVEAGELLERFLWSAVQDEPDAERSREEIADVLIFALLFCEELGIEPAEAIREKLAVNGKKYPVELSRGKATKWDELQSPAWDVGVDGCTGGWLYVGLSDGQNFLIAPDDVIDALVAAVAARIGEVQRLPEDPPVDAEGLPMEMSYAAPEEPRLIV